MRFWLGWGSVLLGAISLFSLVHKLINFGLAPVAQDILSFYRAIFYPIANAIIGAIVWAFSLVQIHLPPIPPDPVIIYALVGGSLFRMIKTSSTTENKVSHLKAAFITLSWPVSALRWTRLIVDYGFQIARDEGEKIRVERWREQNRKLNWDDPRKYWGVGTGARGRGVPAARKRDKRIEENTKQYHFIRTYLTNWVIEIGKVIIAFGLLFGTNAYFSM